MLEFKVTALDDLTSTYDLICGDFKQKLNTLQFDDKTDHYTLNLQNSAILNEDDTFEPKTLKFASTTLFGIDFEEFKRFYRWENRTFILQFKKNGIDWTVFAKKDKESVKQLGFTGNNETESFDLTFKTQTHFLKINTITTEIEYPEDDDIIGYYKNDLLDGDDGYIYNKNLDGEYEGGFIYEDENVGTGFFPVNLPKNKGDKKAYIRIEALEWSSNPSWGLDTLADDTKFSYVSEGLFQTESEVLVCDSLPLLKELKTYYAGTLNVRRNVEALRDFTKKTYLYIPKDKKQHKLIFSDVLKVRIRIYEQYTNV